MPTTFFMVNIPREYRRGYRPYRLRRMFDWSYTQYVGLLLSVVIPYPERCTLGSHLESPLVSFTLFLPHPFCCRSIDSSFSITLGFVTILARSLWYRQFISWWISLQCMRSNQAVTCRQGRVPVSSFCRCPAGWTFVYHQCTMIDSRSCPSWK